VRLSPGVDIVYYLAQFLLVHIVGHRVVGTKDEVPGSVFQNLVHLSLQFFQGSLTKCFAAIVESTQHGTVKEPADILERQSSALPVVERRIDDTARIVYNAGSCLKSSA